MTGRHAPVKGPRLGALTTALVIAVTVSALGVLGWDLSGGRLLAMTTPSMCPTVCVGSLVAIRPLDGAMVHPGELVSFRPPGQNATFTHRVVKVEDNGSFTTKGDAEASPDPWVIPPSDVVGRVSFTLFGLGWWLRALPMVAAGTIVLLFARKAYRLRNRRTFERVFGVLILVVPLWVLHPLIRGVLIEAVPDPHHPGWLKGLFVNTGLLPSHLGVHGAGPIPALGSSQLTWLYAPKLGTSVLGVRQWAALPVWGWAVVAALILSPIIGFALYRATRPVELETRGVPVAQAIALASLEPMAVPDRVPFDIEALEEIPLVHADAPVPEPEPEPQYEPEVFPEETWEPEPVPAFAGIPDLYDVTPAVARFSTYDRSHRAGHEPPEQGPRPGSGSGQPRSAGHRPRQGSGSSRASRRRSRRREQWNVQWPD